MDHLIIDHITIKYRDQPYDKNLKPGFYAERRKMIISPMFKTIEEALYCYPKAEITDQARLAGSWLPLPR